MTEYIKCPKCDGFGGYHDETMDLGKEKLVTCDKCNGEQEIRVGMRYFEVVTPYYALLKAEDKEAAKLEYNASVAGLEDINDINEVPEDYALVMFSRAPGEDRKLVEPNVILEDFRNPEGGILVLDGALL